jgi:hypothetical protein
VFKRMRHQQGCLTRERRKNGTDVLVFRWRETGIGGQRHNRKTVIGAVMKYPTESLAKVAVDGLRLEINKEVPHSISGSITFGQLVSHCQEKELPSEISQARVPKAHSTAVTYRRYMRKWIKPRWDSYLLQDIRPVAVEDWLYTLKLSNGTKAKIRNIMSAVSRHAIRYGFLQAHEGSNPIYYVRQTAETATVPTILTKEVVWNIIARLREPARTMAFLAAFTGLRISELLGLKWADIDFRGQGSMSDVRLFRESSAIANRSRPRDRSLSIGYWQTCCCAGGSRLLTPGPTTGCLPVPNKWKEAAEPGNASQMAPETCGKKCRNIGKDRVAYVPQVPGIFPHRRRCGCENRTGIAPAFHKQNHFRPVAQSTTPNKLAAQRRLIEAIVPKNQAASASTAIN